MAPGGIVGTKRLVAVGLVVALVAVVSGCRFNPLNDTDPEAISLRRQINKLLDQSATAAASGKPNTAKELANKAKHLECANFGCRRALGTVTVAFDPKVAGGFFNAPWPSDARKKADGTIDLTGFPGRNRSDLVQTVVSNGEAATRAFGTNSAIYFRSTGAIDARTLPFAAESTTGKRASIQLLDLDDPSAPPVPVLVDYKPGGTALRPSNLITVLPYPGHPLAPGSRYVALLFDSVRDPSGKRLAPAPIIKQLDGPTPPGVSSSRWAQLRKDRNDAVAAVRSRTLYHPTELVAFAAFTTQDPTAEMGAVARSVAALPSPSVLSRTPATTPCAAGQTSVTTGRIGLPSWQQGTRPFVPAGGGVVLGGDGNAVQQGVQMGADGAGVVFKLGVPCGPAPDDGWPILIWMDGTGGSAQASGIGELGSNLPYAVLSVAPLYSSDRLEEAADPFDTPEFQFFNFINPLAGRTNIVQQAADVLYLARVFETLTLPAEEAGGTVHGSFDLGTVVVAGHSQGATSAPLTLAVAPSNVKGGFLSAGGGGLYHSVVLRGEVRPLVDLILGTGETGELDVFHPYPQLLQTFAEVGDATNYASSITADLALYGGLRDGCTAIETATHLATALDIPISNPQTRRPLFGPNLSAVFPGYTPPFEPEVVTAPVSQNLAGGRTGLLVQVDSGHFGATTYPAIGRSFIDSIAAGGPVTVNPGATPAASPGSSCPRFNAPPVP
ncbi:hypothetical protein ACE2AJ_18795 [Aquihabitans daechungensis]|uniref:hypothetical protein n=1 Tax=Aquihabitans daechungensis TaxID=1052257 RepID=UPI003B9F7BB0